MADTINTQRINWWMDRAVDEMTLARAAFKNGSIQVALANVASAVEALADTLGELERRDMESSALDLRNDLFTMSETWEEKHNKEGVKE